MTIQELEQLCNEIENALTQWKARVTGGYLRKDRQIEVIVRVPASSEDQLRESARPHKQHLRD